MRIWISIKLRRFRSIKLAKQYGNLCKDVALVCDEELKYAVVHDFELNGDADAALSKFFTALLWHCLVIIGALTRQNVEYCK